MKKTRLFPPVARHLIPLILCLLSASAFGDITAAGTRIINSAVGTYELDGQAYRVESNIVSVEVRALYGLSIFEDAPQTNPLTFPAAPGTQVLVPFTLTNTGNAIDSYSLGFAVGPGSDLQYGTISAYLDTDSDGMLDPGEPEAVQTYPLRPGESVALLVCLDIRSFAVPGQMLSFALTATSLADGTKVDNDNWRIVRVSVDAVLSARKSSSTSQARPGEQVTYSIEIANLGNRPTQNRTFTNIDRDGIAVDFEPSLGLFVRDDLPAGISVSGDPAVDFPFPRQVGTVPLYGYANGNWSLLGDQTAWGGSNSVRSVGFLLPDPLQPGQDALFSWLGRIDSPQAASIISNSAEIDWGDGSGDRRSQTNTVLLRVDALAGVALGPKGDPLGLSSGSYLSPSLTQGPYTLSFSGNISTADYLSPSAMNSSTIVFWNTLRNTGTFDDSFELSYEWSADSLPGAGVRFFSADGLVPLFQARDLGPARVGPFGPGEDFSFRVEVTLPLGTTSDAIDHDLKIKASSLADSDVHASTMDRMRFGLTSWLPFTKTANPSPDVAPGDPIAYRITFGNSGSVPAANASVFDILPFSLRAPHFMTDGFVSGFIGGNATSIPVAASFTPNDPAGSAGRIVWTFPSIPVGFSGVLEFQSLLDPSEADGSATVNRATITAVGMPAAVSNSTTTIAMRPNRLVAEKFADKAAAARGALIRYTVKIKNVSETARIDSPLFVQDSLPKGFNYISGSATLNGIPLGDPEKTTGANTLLWADLGRLEPDSTAILSYSVLIGSAAPTGENFNTAFAEGLLASGRRAKSNTASARVVVYENLAVDSQAILGRVYYDLNGNRLPDEGEPGLPGTRIYLENGTYTVTDSQGKYHFEDIKAGTHVVKLDRGSLPRGVILLGPSRVGGLGDSDSILVELIRGELFKANFRVSGIPVEAQEMDLTQVANTLPPETVEFGPRACLGVSYELKPGENRLDERLGRVTVDRALAGPLEDSYLVLVPEKKDNPGVSPTDVVDLSSIYIEDKPPQGTFPFEGAVWIKLPLGPSGFDAKAFDRNGPRTNPTAFDQGSRMQIRYISQASASISHYVVGINTQGAISVLGEDDPEDRQTLLPLDDPAVELAEVYRILHPQAFQMLLAEDPRREGKRKYGIASPGDGETYWTRDKISVTVRFPKDAQPRFQAAGKDIPLETVGRQIIDPGRGIRQLEFVGVPLLPGKNSLEFSYVDRGAIQTHEIQVFLAGTITSISHETNPRILFADGKTEPEIVIKPRDAEGIPLPDGSLVTLSIDKGRFANPDANPQREGFQARIEKGVARVRLSAEFLPSQRTLEITAGNFSEIIVLEFLPFLRDWIIAGYGRLTTRYTINAPNIYGDGPEHDGGFSSDGRAAFFAKGTLFGCYLLTAAADTTPDKPEDSLFQELSPEVGYPIYGDSSQQKYEAETSAGAFLKIEKDKSYFLFGDYETGFASPELTKYSRSLTGAKISLDNGKVKVDAFYSNTAQSMVKDELRGDGSSGYYLLSRKNILENTDKLRLETRSVHDPSMVLETRNLLRYADYWINFREGTILFKEPVPRSDGWSNPVYIVAVYEVEESEDSFDIVGVRPVLRLFDNSLAVGAVGILERGAIRDNLLYGADLSLALGKHFSARAEAAWSDVLDISTLNYLSGTAQTVSFKADFGNALNCEARYHRADEDFRNPNLSSFKGALEDISLRLSSRSEEGLDILVDATRRTNLLSGDLLMTAGLQWRIRVTEEARLILGARYVDLMETSYSQKSLLGKVGLTADLTARLTSTFFFETALWGDHLDGEDFSSASSLLDRLTSVSANASPMGEGYMATGADTSLAGYPDRVFLGMEYEVGSGSKIQLGQEWMGTAPSIVGRTLLGISSEIFKNTYAFANYGMEDGFDGPRNMAAFGLKGKIDLSPRLSATLGLGSLYTLQGAVTDNYIAPQFGLAYLDDRLKHAFRLEYRLGSSDQRALVEFASSMKVEENLSFLLKDSFSLTLYHAGSKEYRHHASLGVAYRPLFSDRLNLLAKVSFTDTLDVDAVQSLKLLGQTEAHVQPTADLSFSAKYSAKWLYDQADGVGTGNFLDLYALRLVYDVLKDVDFGFHFGFMPNWASNTLDYYAGIETGYRLVKNLYASAGWNYRGLKDEDLVDNSYHSIGFFLSLRIKFDEDSLGLGMQ